MNLTLAICSIQEEKEDALICVSATHVSLICTQKTVAQKRGKEDYEEKVIVGNISRFYGDGMFSWVHI